MATLGQMQVPCPLCGVTINVSVATAPLSLIENNTMTVKLQASHHHDCPMVPGPGEHVCECGATRLGFSSEHGVTAEMQCVTCGTWTKEVG